MNVSAAFPVTDASQIAEPRRVVHWLAAALDFSEERAGRAALIVSELASNLVKHARSGELLIRPLTTRDGAREGIEVISLDKGPGMPDVASARRDGFSTSGTLGNGLGALGRQADALEFYSDRTGTAIAAQLWRGTPPGRLQEPRFEVGAVQVAKPGEVTCGDDWAWRMRDGRLSILVADGLGHGLPAREAADAAVGVFGRVHDAAPARVIDDVHAALRPTRGAAVAVLAIDLEGGTARFAGLGNVSGRILLPAGGRHNMVSHNGTAGHTAARIQEFGYPVPPGSIVLMFSDGLSSQCDLSGYPGLLRRGASLLAAVLYRDFSRRRDDVTVVVAKERQAVAEKL